MNSQNETFISHLTELRYRLMISLSALLIGFFMCFYIADYIFNFLTTPLVDVFGDISNRRLIYTGLAEKFFTNVKLAFLLRLCLCFQFCYLRFGLLLPLGYIKMRREFFSHF